ncbi:MAG: hypothetical protein US43_C0006G0012 [Candidatus Levybacteria bacterium GW2011_GWA1_37_16]|nr:MAG: hypothetical protein US43_C0006G0012 [Candidatus Levybacteria bacterium GW2011_GWA1_37_16]
MGELLKKVPQEVIVGRMPKPQYLNIPSPFQSGNSPIGVVARSPIDGKEKPFIWINRNFCPSSSLDSEGRRDEIARRVTGLILSNDVEIVVGPAINFEKCDEKTGKIAIQRKFRGNHVYGYYIESSRRPGFNFTSADIGEGDLRYRLIREGKPKLFGETLKNVKSNLPNLK